MKYLRNGTLVERPGPEMSSLPSGVSGVFETLLVQSRSQPDGDVGLHLNASARARVARAEVERDVPIALGPSGDVGLHLNPCAGKLVFWKDHWRRFEDGLRAFGLPMPITAEALRHHANALAAANGVRDGVLRYAAWRDTDGGMVWQVEATPPRPSMRKQDLRITWGPVVETGGVDHRFKHLNRTAWAAAVRAARASGYDEALLVDAQGHVVEAGTANVFVVRQGEVHTPALENGPLPGIVRTHVIATARQVGLTVRERPIARAELATADEVWLTNSLVGIRPVSALDTQRFDPERPVLNRLRAAWAAQHGWDPLVVCND